MVWKIRRLSEKGRQRALEELKELFENDPYTPQYTKIAPRPYRTGRIREHPRPMRARMTSPLYRWEKDEVEIEELCDGQWVKPDQCQDTLIIKKKELERPCIYCREGDGLVLRAEYVPKIDFDFIGPEGKGIRPIKGYWGYAVIILGVSEQYYYNDLYDAVGCLVHAEESQKTEN